MDSSIQETIMNVIEELVRSDFKMDNVQRIGELQPRTY